MERKLTHFSDAKVQQWNLVLGADLKHEARLAPTGRLHDIGVAMIPFVYLVREDADTIQIGEEAFARLLAGKWVTKRSLVWRKNRSGLQSASKSNQGTY
jgi:hypothetical protein